MGSSITRVCNVQDDIPYRQWYYLQVAKSQNDKKKDMVVATQLIKAIAVAASNLLQWLGPH
jgi:hypothetical protein